MQFPAIKLSKIDRASFLFHPKSNCHHLLNIILFQTCMAFFLHDILKNVGDQTFLVTIDYHCVDKTCISKQFVGWFNFGLWQDSLLVRVTAGVLKKSVWKQLCLQFRNYTLTLIQSRSLICP